MSKILQEKTIKFLISNIEKTGKINNPKTPKDYFNTISNLNQNKQIEHSKTILEHIIKFQNKNGLFEFKEEFKTQENQNINPIFFLETLIKISKEENSIFKKYIKNIKKTYSYLEEHFDDIYLLIFNQNENENIKKFSILENAIFLSIADSLFEKLNEINENDLADKFFMIKNKIELGFQRYFYNFEKKILIQEFSPELKTYKIINKKTLFEILSKTFLLEETIKKKEIEKYKKEIDKQEIINLNEYLQFLILLKVHKENETNKLLNKITKYLDFFPEKIIKNKTPDFTIEKSIFLDFQENIKTFKKDNSYIENLNSIETANLILELLKKN